MRADKTEVKEDGIETRKSVVLGRHAQVHDGQHHENEGLQRDDQDVERGPDEAGDELQRRHHAGHARWSGRRRASCRRSG